MNRDDASPKLVEPAMPLFSWCRRVVAGVPMCFK